MKTLKLIAIFLLLLNGTNTTYSQFEKIIENYTISENKGILNYFTGSINLFSTNINGYNFNVNGGAKLTYFFDRIRGNLEYKYSYLNRINEHIGGSSSNVSIYKDSPSNNIRAEIGFSIHQYEKEEEIDVTLYHQSNITYYTFIKGNVGYRWSIDAGYEKGITYFSFGNLTQLQGYNLTTNEIISFTSNPSNSEIFTIGTQSIDLTEGYSTYYDYSIISVGVSKTKTYNLKCTIPNYGEKLEKSTTRLYSDLLFGFGKFDNINYQYVVRDTTNSYNTTWKIEQNEIVLDGYVKTLPIGIKIGIERHNLKGTGLGYEIEGGIFPGASKGLGILYNLFINIKFINVVLGKNLR